MSASFYRELLEPHITADLAAVTLSTTYKALAPVSNLPRGIGNLFQRPGRKLRIKMFGRLTTGATPGNLQLGLLYGTGADANGVTVCQSATVALTASQTNMSWRAEFVVHVRSIGSAGTLLGIGELDANPAVISSSLQPVLIPASAPAVSAAVDLTNSALFLSPQMLRSGSTAEAVTLHDLQYELLN